MCVRHRARYNRKLQRRMPHVKDAIVQRTESAVMLEVEMFYSMATGGNASGGDEEEATAAEEKKADKKKD